MVPRAEAGGRIEVPAIDDAVHPGRGARECQVGQSDDQGEEAVLLGGEYAGRIRLAPAKPSPEAP